jgi:hypothetical protein
MSQHVIETRSESDAWLPITEFSVRSGMSLSTIRRKIKSNSIQFKVDKGKYFILYQEAPSQSASFKPTVEKSHQPLELELINAPEKTTPKVEIPDDIQFPMVDTAVKMVSTAFEHALKEKDLRIKILEKRNRELEDRLTEVKLLVQMLEQKYKVRY